jgi:hypothetical protein
MTKRDGAANPVTLRGGVMDKERHKYENSITQFPKAKTPHMGIHNPKLIHPLK